MKRRVVAGLQHSAEFVSSTPLSRIRVFNTGTPPERSRAKINAHQ
jgi:hypothetical protein